MSHGIDPSQNITLRKPLMGTPVLVEASPESLEPDLAQDQSSEALNSMGQQALPPSNALVEALKDFKLPQAPKGLPARNGLCVEPPRQGPNPARELVHAASTATMLVDQVYGNPARMLTQAGPAVVRGLQAVAQDGGMFAKGAGFAAKLLGQGVAFAQAHPWLAASSNFLGKLAPVLGVAYAAFDIAKASLEPEGPNKIRMEGGAVVSTVGATLGVAAASLGAVAAASAASVAITGVAAVGLVTLAAPAALVVGLGAMSLGLLSMADGLFNGGRAQSWLGQSARSLFGRSPLFF